MTLRTLTKIVTTMNTMPRILVAFAILASLARVRPASIMLLSPIMAPESPFALRFLREGKPNDGHSSQNQHNAADDLNNTHSVNAPLAYYAR